jgi:hypothetical protein
MNLWSAFIRPVSAHFRKRRFRQLLAIAPDLLSQRILDVGGTSNYWQHCGVDWERHDITILNVTERDAMIEMKRSQ